MPNSAQVSALLKRIDKVNPELYSAISLLAQDLYALFYQVNPITSSTSTPAVAATVIAPINLLINALPNALQISWDAADNAFAYEIRMGSDWDTATSVLITSSTVANLDPIILSLIYGTYTFLIKSINISGTRSDDTASISFTVPQIGASVITGQAIGNNAILSWTVPPSLWQISYYRIKKDSVLIGNFYGTFQILTEFLSGTYAYLVEGVDIVGNIGTDSNSVSLALIDPADYFDLATLNAAYGGTYTKCVLTEYPDGVDAIAGPLTIETFQQHFVNNGWTTPQDQINAGYPYYQEPTETTGNYIEQFDFGSLHANVTIVASFNFIQAIGSTVVTTEISYSTDNITYTAYAAGPSVFAASVRYVRVKWVFTSGDNLSFGWISQLNVRLNVQFILDSGSAAISAADVGGTVVTMNKTFSLLESVTVTPIASIALYPVATTFTTTTFRVLVFDASGFRANATVSWKARGIAP